MPKPTNDSAVVMKARVLSSFTLDDLRVEPNDLIAVTAEQADAYKGHIDTSADAVAYAESLKRP